VDFTPVKRCSNCFKWKEFSAFYKRNNQGDGLQGRCKACNAEVVQAYNSKKKNRVYRRRAEVLPPKKFDNKKDNERIYMFSNYMEFGI
jgi:hypothetical protein